jgi:O-antigen/teichoic acid export membrane protein
MTTPAAPPAARPDALAQEKGWLDRTRRLRATLGIDRAVFYSLSGKGVQIIAGVLNIVLVARLLSPAEQGYLYTFQSLVALQILFDLSLPAVLAQFAGHEMAGLDWKPDGTVQGAAAAKSRLASLVRISNRWYSVASLLMALALSAGGLAFFTGRGAGTSVPWQEPWLALSLLAPLLIALTPLLGIVEGCGRVSEVAAFRTIQESASSLLYFAALILGAGLFSLPILYLARVAMVSAYLRFYRGRFFRDLRSVAPAASVHFRDEMWPFQWRFLICAVSSVIGALIITPMVFAAQGAVVAGQVGMTLAVATALGAVSMVWVNTKVPLFCNLVARRRFDELDAVFFRIAGQALAVCALMTAGLAAAILVLDRVHPALASRLADPIPSILILASVLLSFPNIAASAYLRAHKREVTAPANAAVSAAMAVALYFASRRPGLVELALVICVGSGLLSAWVVALFVRYRRQWHAPSAAGAEAI